MAEKPNQGGGDVPKLIGVLRRFNQFDPRTQVSTILTFLEIASAVEKHKPLSVQDVEKRVGLNSGMASRNIHDWLMATGK